MSFEKNKIVYILVISIYVLITVFAKNLVDVYHYVYVIFLFGATCFLSIKNKIKIDIIPILLLLRSLFFIVNGYVLGVEFLVVWEQELVTYVGVLAYIFAVNFSSKEKEEIKHILIFTTLITSFQILESILVNGLDKNYIGAGVGMSNYAAAFLLMGLTYLLFSKKNLFEKVVFGFSIIMFLLVQSFGACFAFAIMVICYLLKYVNWKRKAVWVTVSISIVLLTIALLLMFTFAKDNPIIDKIIVKISALLSGDLNTFGSSRPALYKFTIENILRNPWFGNILNYNSSYDIEFRWQYFRTHNFLFESLLLYGIVGTVINIFVIICIVKKMGKGFLNNNFNFICFLIVVGAFVHGAIEPNLFTFNYSLFFWLIVGAMINNCNKKLKKISYFNECGK